VDELDLRIRNRVYASFVRDGTASTPAEAAAELGLAEAEVGDAYRRLHDAHALVLEQSSTRVRMLNPFSAVETPHPRSSRCASARVRAANLLAHFVSSPMS